MILASLSVSDWEVLAPLLIGSICTSVANAIIAVRGHTTGKEALEQGAETLRQVSPPSNGHTLGELTESVVNASAAAAVEATRVRQELHPELPVPPPIIPEAVLPIPGLTAPSAPPPIPVAVPVVPPTPIPTVPPQTPDAS